MFSRNLRVALIEDNIAWADKAANVEQLRRNLRNVPEGTDLVVLPELFTTGFIVGDRDTAAHLAERNIDDTIATLHQLARHYNLALCGSFLAHTAGQLYNRAFFIEANGEETFYDKRHLFAFAGEDSVYKQGYTLAPIVRYRGFNIKLIVCYDLRFPELARRQAIEGAEILVYPAAWVDGAGKKRQWETLLAARAIENELFVVGVCRADDGYIGSSLVAAPDGSLLVEGSGDEGLYTCELDTESLEPLRENMPIFGHRRPDIY